MPNPDVVGSSNIKKLGLKRILKFNIKPGDGVFVILKDFFGTKLSNFELSTLKPLYEPTDLHRYAIKKTNSKEIIYLSKSVEDKKIPHLLEHLQKYREIMDERRENISGRLKYYQLHWPRDIYFFEPGPKILAPRKCAKPVFTYTEDEAYVMMSINVIRAERIDQKYLVALLNSKLITFWLRYKGKMQGNNYQIDKEPIINLPIYEAPKEEQKDLTSLAVRIIEFVRSSDYLANSEKQAKVMEMERKVDEMVYELYGLTSEEIKIVEQSK